jgi:hypothetical protein
VAASDENRFDNFTFFRNEQNGLTRFVPILKTNMASAIPVFLILLRLIVSGGVGFTVNPESNGHLEQPSYRSLKKV